MAYKISRTNKVPKEYWRERELQRLRRKYKGKLPPPLVITKTGTRRILGVPEKLHKKGTFIEYKGQTAIITKATKKGIYIMPLKKPNGILEPARKKPLFIPEKKYAETKLTYVAIPII